MNAKLLVVVGKTTKREVDLQLPAVLGRSREADVTVAHPLISRRHCEISEDNGVLVLRDLGSLNGTMIGGRRIEFSALMPEAEFAIGPLTFRVLYDYDGDLESVPETRFFDVVEGPTDADGGQSVSADSGGEATHFVEAPPTEAAQESISGELAMPDLLALADAEIEKLVPPAPPVPSPATRPRPATQSTGQFSRVAAPGSPALADVKLPTMRRPDGLDGLWMLTRRCNRGVTNLPGGPSRRQWKNRRRSRVRGGRSRLRRATGKLLSPKRHPRCHPSVRFLNHQTKGHCRRVRRKGPPPATKWTLNSATSSRGWIGAWWATPEGS